MAPWLSLDDAARQLGLSKATVWRRYKDGSIEGHKVDDRVMLSRRSVEAFARRNEPLPQSHPDYQALLQRYEEAVYRIGWLEGRIEELERQLDRGNVLSRLYNRLTGSTSREA